MKHILSLLTIVFFALGPAWNAHPAASVTNRPVIIFDTNMGSDVDDAGALALLHRLADLGEVELVGVIFSSGKNRFGVGVCDAINTWYGRSCLRCSGEPCATLPPRTLSGTARPSMQSITACCLASPRARWRK